MIIGEKERDMILEAHSKEQLNDVDSPYKRNTVILNGQVVVLTLDNIHEYIPEIKKDMTKQEIIQLLCHTANWNSLPMTETWAYHAVAPLYDITKADYYNDWHSLTELDRANIGDTNYKPIGVAPGKPYSILERIEQLLRMHRDSSSVYTKENVIERIEYLIKHEWKPSAASQVINHM